MNDWENPRLFNRNRLPARSYFIPFADDATCVGLGMAMAFDCQVFPESVDV